MPKRKQQFNRFEVTAIQLECSNQIFLSTILRNLESCYKSIIGIIRVADYCAKIYDSTVFVYFADTFEVERFLNRNKILIGGQLCKVSHPNLIVAKANILENYDTKEMQEIAASGFTCALATLNLNIYKQESNTFNTIKIIETFEQQEIITGFKFAYCERSHRVRTFGMILTFHPSIMENKFVFNGVEIALEIPKSIPILIYHTYDSLLTNKQCSVTPLICSLNYLHANLANSLRSIHPAPAETSWIERCSRRGDLADRNPIHLKAIKLLNSGLRLAEREQQGTSRLVIQTKNSGRTVQKREERIEIEASDISSEDDGISIGKDYELTEEGEIRCPNKKPCI